MHSMEKIINDETSIRKIVDEGARFRRKVMGSGLMWERGRIT